MFLGNKVRPVRGADNFTAVYEPIFYKQCGILNISRPYRPPRSVMGIALLFFTCKDHAIMQLVEALCY
jgi:hypothetical protein